MSITQIATNYEALFANKMVAQMSSKASSAMTHIASGKRIVSAADDAVGVAMLSSFEAKMGNAHELQRNFQDTAEVLKFSDQLLSQIEDTLIEMQAIAVRIGNDATMTTNQMAGLSAQYAALNSTITTGALSSVTWNGKVISSATTQAAEKIVTDMAGSTTTLSTLAPTAYATNWDGGAQAVAATVDTTTAGAAITTIDTALGNIGTYRAELGAAINFVETSLNNAMSAEVNYASSASAIGDADIAAEVTAMSGAQILSQAGTAMIAQANMSSQIVLGLLG